jgi:hypothetical protein
MTRRALLWCGWADPARKLDFPASVKDLDLAARAARALGIMDQDIHAFLGHEDLLSSSLAPSQYPATVEALERVTARLAHSSAEDDALLFVATNHGEAHGLLTAAPVDEFASEGEVPRLLTPEVLRRCLDALPGAQVLVLATCHAGIFLPLAREQRIVLASCAADQRYLVQEEPACSPFLLELFKAWCSTELPGYETRFSSSIAELDAAFIQAEQQLISGPYPAEYRRLKPLCQGAAHWPLSQARAASRANHES